MAERWFRIKGQAKGDRSVDEQMKGLRRALDETRGRTVLDLGCAEGLIGIEFARAGAVAVHGIERLQRHIDVAKTISGELPLTFQCADLSELARHEMALELPQRYDIVLALAILHKLEDPALGAKFCAWSARSLVVVRLPANSDSRNGILQSKHNPKQRCNLSRVMQEHGFLLERTEPGPRKETVQYWRRRR